MYILKKYSRYKKINFTKEVIIDISLVFHDSQMTIKSHETNNSIIIEDGILINDIDMKEDRYIKVLSISEIFHMKKYLPYKK